MSEDMIRRLDLVQSYFVREGLGFDELCIAVEEARDLIKSQGSRLHEMTNRSAAAESLIAETVEKYNAADKDACALRSRLDESVKETARTREWAEDLNSIVNRLKAELDEASPMQTCARCGKQDRAHRMMIEEGDEWECQPCWERCEALERADAAKLEDALTRCPKCTPDDEFHTIECAASSSRIVEIRNTFTDGNNGKG